MSVYKAEKEFGCKLDLAWRGRCNALAGSDSICRSHLGIKCVSCGAQAIRECDYTGQFVCGTPLCEKCEGYNVTGVNPGAWGFMGHKHRMKREFAPKGDRPMDEADLYA